MDVVSWVVIDGNFEFVVVELFEEFVGLWEKVFVLVVFCLFRFVFVRDVYFVLVYVNNSGIEWYFFFLEVIY